MSSCFQSVYFKAYLLCFISGLFILLNTEYGGVVLFINRHRTQFLDTVMPLLTHLGDGIFYALVALALMLYRWRLGLFLAISGVLQAIVSALLKRVIFGKVPRPTKYFRDGGVSLDLIPGVDNANVFSFPSGHTMTIFMMTALLSFTIMPKKYHIPFLLIAIIAGFTRIYLLQHFMQDVIAGSLVGVVMAAILTTTLYPKLVLKK